MAASLRSLTDLPRRLFRVATGARPSRSDLLLRFPTSAIGAEIGVWEGDFSKRLLRSLRPRALHLVDPWQAFPGRALNASQRNYYGAAGVDQAHMDQVARSVAERFRGNASVLIHRMTSASFFEHAAATGLVLDWIYIDGDHETPAVSADLTGAWAIVRPGGLVAGDDYFLKRQNGHEPVKAAVTAFSEKIGMTPEIIGTQFLFVKPAWASGTETNYPAGVASVRGGGV